ncbi:hypothetical protein [Bacillus sp. FJAT-28004]|uniref:hypothetical protein n=1 Tax=Bacillus sp. FJAT-28004 TaxID=1679165 RepID=UPI0006B52EAC|nr:hypothetical protein [Bacillus sp. FJAT-28004]
MDFTIHELKSSIYSFEHSKIIDASYLVFGSFKLRSKRGKDTECYIVAKYYDDNFQETKVDIAHHRHIHTQKFIDCYKDIVDQINIELLKMPYVSEIKQEDSLYRFPKIKITGHRSLEGDKHEFTFCMDDLEDKNYLMEIDKVNGNWEYWVRSFFNNCYPSNIRKHIFEQIKVTKPYRNYFVY